MLNRRCAQCFNIGHGIISEFASNVHTEHMLFDIVVFFSHRRCLLLFRFVNVCLFSLHQFSIFSCTPHFHSEFVWVFFCFTLLACRHRYSSCSRLHFYWNHLVFDKRELHRYRQKTTTTTLFHTHTQNRIVEFDYLRIHTLNPQVSKRWTIFISSIAAQCLAHGMGIRFLLLLRLLYV